MRRGERRGSDRRPGAEEGWERESQICGPTWVAADG